MPERSEPQREDVPHDVLHIGWVAKAGAMQTIHPPDLCTCINIAAR